MSGLAVAAAVVGGGPAGLACASLLLKAGVAVCTFDPLGAAMRPDLPAPGKDDIAFSVALESYARAAVEVEAAGFLYREAVKDIRWNRRAYQLELVGGRIFSADYVVLATGTSFPDGWAADHDARRLPTSRFLDADLDSEPDGLLAVDDRMRTEMSGCYAVGSLASGYVPNVSCANGMGSRAALDIISSISRQLSLP